MDVVATQGTRAVGAAVRGHAAVAVVVGASADRRSGVVANRDSTGTNGRGGGAGRAAAGVERGHPGIDRRRIDVADRAVVGIDRLVAVVAGGVDPATVTGVGFGSAEGEGSDGGCGDGKNGFHGERVSFFGVGVRVSRSWGDRLARELAREGNLLSPRGETREFGDDSKMPKKVSPPATRKTVDREAKCQIVAGIR